MSTTISGTSGVTFPDSTSMQTGQQACKAWVNFNGTGTVAIRAAYNVSSITDNGTGNYTVNFTTAMVDANYSVICSASDGGMANTDTMVNPYVWNVNSVYLGANNYAGTPVDRAYINLAIFSN